MYLQKKVLQVLYQLSSSISYLVTRRPRRSATSKPACINVDRLRDREVRGKYAEALDKVLISSVARTGDVNSDWGTLSSQILDTATATLGPRVRKNEDWFDDNDVVLMEAINKHRRYLRREGEAR